jgi:hypothetical protein
MAADELPRLNAQQRDCLERQKRKRAKKAAKLAAPLETEARVMAEDSVEIRRFRVLGIDKTEAGSALARFELALLASGEYKVVSQDVGKYEKRASAMNKFKVASVKDVLL